MTVTVTEAPRNQLAEYAAFLARRSRFIAVGALGAVLVMAAITATLPTVYSTWAVIDAGSYGDSHPAAVDELRDRFNAGWYRTAIADFPAKTISKAWMLVTPPYALVRVDGSDGESVARAARAIADLVVRELEVLPKVQPAAGSPAADQSAVKSLKDQLWPVLTTATRHLEAARAERLRIVTQNDETTSALNRLAGARSGAVGDWRAHAKKLEALAGQRQEADARVEALELFATQLRQALIGNVTERALTPLRRATEVTYNDFDQVRSIGEELRETLGPAISTPFRQAQMTRQPAAPSDPTLPNWTINLLVALIFGLIASTFAAVLLERDWPRSLSGSGR